MSLNAENSVRLPLGRITRAVNSLLLRALGGLFPLWGPLILGICALTGIVMMSNGSPANGLLVIFAPFGVLIALVLAWLLIANHLVMLFGERDSDRESAMYVMVIFVLPIAITMAALDTLFFLSMKPSLSSYMLAAMPLVVMGLGLFGINWVATRKPHRIGLAAHALNTLLALAVMESVFPYPQTVIDDALFTGCNTMTSFRRTGLRVSGTSCLVRFEQDGKTREIRLARDGKPWVQVRHGLLDHYR